MLTHQAAYYTASILSLAVESVARARCAGVHFDGPARETCLCERRIRDPVVSWAPVAGEGGDCKGFIQHF